MPGGPTKSVQAVLDSRAAVNLIDQATALLCELEPAPDKPPQLAWVGAERKNTYAAHKVRMSIKDDFGEKRIVEFVAFGVDKEGPELVLGNLML